MNIGIQQLREKIAREAASLLYTGAEKEYKQAKLKAAHAFQSKFLPTNLEVAIELDRLAEENEGSARQKRLIQMRKEALKLMQILRAYKTLLIGSVWRGTIHYDSDIDIIVYHDKHEDILGILKQKGLKITHTEWTTVTKKGKRMGAFHIYAELTTKEKVEIKIVPSSETYRKATCEIYGDEITGLSRQVLERVLKENPTQRFLSI
ncbi:nucleotidyltransferase domain-containing protein [Candidatus Bathyarchaeota archaeon]|nr:nucleotidyltransferase domain-containing protein [Candidatus Bathyarchaeota archaeon]